MNIKILILFLLIFFSVLPIISANECDNDVSTNDNIINDSIQSHSLIEDETGCHFRYLNIDDNVCGYDYVGNQLINNEDYINNYTFSDLSLNKGMLLKIVLIWILQIFFQSIVTINSQKIR